MMTKLVTMNEWYKATYTHKAPVNGYHLEDTSFGDIGDIGQP